jgi:hypothetical protein
MGHTDSAREISYALGSTGNAERLGMLLVERGALAPGEIERALADQEQHGGKLGEILLERGLISRPLLTRVLAQQAGVELEAERGFGSGLRELIERRQLEKSRVRLLPVEPEKAQDPTVGVDVRPRPTERRFAERRAQPDRRRADADRRNDPTSSR